MKRLLCSVLVLFIAASAFGAAKTEVRLLLSGTSARPGDTVWAGIELKMPPGWHTYWRNGGDAGLPTKVEWTLPPGVTAGEIQWPVPEKLVTPAGDMSLITYVYENRIVLPVPLRIGTNAAAGSIPIEAKVSWQECQEVCIQGKISVLETLDVGQSSVASPNAQLIEEWRQKVPRIESNPKAQASWVEPGGTNDSRKLVIRLDTTATSADFYALGGEDYEVTGATGVSNSAPGHIELHKTVVKSGEKWPTSIQGLLVQKPGESVQVSLPITEQGSVAGAPPNANGTKAGNWGLLPQMLLFALLGGLILNVMPCVLPVISLKVLAFVNQSKESPARLRNLGLVYGFGVLVSFAVLAAFSKIIQQAGGVADWGAAFRNPQFRMIITIVITLVALNLFGVFEITLSGNVMGKADNLTSRHGYSGAFFNGVLATILATPCTAPFLGGALAFAFTQPPVINMAVFLAAGIGLALPFVVICFKPSLLKFIPRPGMWMERFKVGIGFAVLATAMWLFWLTGTRLGKDGVLWLGLFLVTLSFAAWVWGQFVQRSGKHMTAGAVSAAVVLLAGYFGILENKLHWRASTVMAAEKIEWRTWSPEAVAKARSEGRPVLVDFTADSCLNCQVNKLTSIEIPAVRSKLKEINAVAFIADYTDENPAIAKELAKFQRSGVPMVLVYPARSEGDPIVLPTVLTPTIVEKALAQVAH